MTQPKWWNQCVVSKVERPGRDVHLSGQCGFHGVICMATCCTEIKRPWDGAADTKHVDEVSSTGCGESPWVLMSSAGFVFWEWRRRFQSHCGKRYYLAAVPPTWRSITYCFVTELD